MLNDIYDYFNRRMLQRNLRKMYKKENIYLYGPVDIVHPENIIFSGSGRVSINSYSYLNATSTITIGDNVSLSAHCMLITTSLDRNNMSSYEHISSPIKIGNNVQIGAGAIILPGVEIGNNVMVGAGSVVTKNVDSYLTVVGNPARPLN